MNRILLLAALVGCLASVALTGCAAKDPDALAPTKAEIDKGLQGKPAIDPNLGAPMKPGKGGP